MNKKGFTLIELLAVIIILAVLSLIVVPIVGNVIESAKIASDLRSAESYVKAGENYFAASILDTSKKAKLGKVNVLDELEVSTRKATGKLYVEEDGSISMALLIRGKCYTKTAHQGINEITVSDDENCGSLPEVEISEVRIPNTGEYAREVSVTIPVTSGMTSYVKLGSNKEITSGTVSEKCNNDLSSCESTTDTTLLANTWYKISSSFLEIKTNEELSIDIKTTDGHEYSEQNYSVEKIDNNAPSTPVISGGSNSWSTTAKTISIDTASTAASGIEKYQYYISTSNSSQTGGSWIDMNSEGQSITSNGEHYIYVKAISNSGLESSIAGPQTVKVDTGSVSVPVISGGSSTESSDPVTISITTESTAYSGISGYEYYVSSSETELTGGSWQAVTDNEVTIEEDGISYVYIRGVSNAGVRSEASLPQTVNIKSGPKIGDYFKIDNEGFYIIGFEDSGSKIKLLAEWNLLVGNTCSSYSSSSCAAITNPTGKQDSSAKGYHYAAGTTTEEYPSIGTVKFSSSNYWVSGSSLKSLYGSSYPAYVCTDSNCIPKGYVDTYKGILEGYGASIIEARLIKKEEIDDLYNYYSNTTGKTLSYGSITSWAPSWLYNTSYWTGSAYSNNYVWHVHSYGSFNYDSYSDGIGFVRGVRPVIVIKASALN